MKAGWIKRLQSLKQAIIGSNSRHPGSVFQLLLPLNYLALNDAKSTKRLNEWIGGGQWLKEMK